MEWIREGVESWNERRARRDFVPDFSSAHLTNINFEGANLEYADFREAKFFQSANLIGARLRNARFQNAFLFKALLDNVQAGSANFTDANLCGAYLTDGKFPHADFSNANLIDAHLEGADLVRANLVGANLTNTQPWTAKLYPERESINEQNLELPEDLQTVRTVEGLITAFKEIRRHYKKTLNEKPPYEDYLFYFRGERIDSWDLCPSIMRSENLRSREGEMLFTLMSQRPEDFDQATTALSQLVLAQHHGLPTRLLDITRNPLVALFHACADSSGRNKPKEEDGCLHIFVVPKHLVKSYNSDTVSILANFAKLPRFWQDLIMGKLASSEERQSRRSLGEECSYSMNRLYHHIGQEKPHFKEKINIRDFFKVFVVEPQQSFERIRAQSGAFFISAFHKRLERDNILKLNKDIPVYDYYRLIVPAQEKKTILNDLQLMNVTHEVLFPGLDEVARAIVDRNVQ